MKTQLFIPSKIKVGYQNRSDTYTKKLAYVIYYDHKNVLRKQTSWENWRDKKIKDHDFENVPTEGFVLNKKAGGYSSGWDHRATYCRVFDPRGFEFEITIDNLLFILQETDATRGKGLIGEFVYAWDGKELALLPAHCEEYVQSQKFTKLQDGKVGVKDLSLGCVYRTKKQEDLIYLGKFNWFEKFYNYYDSKVKSVEFSKSYIFVNKQNKFVHMNSLTNLSAKLTDTCVSNYSELIEKLMKSGHSGGVKNFESSPHRVKFPESYYCSYNDYETTKLEGVYFRELEPNKFQACTLVQVNAKDTHDYGYYSKIKGYKIIGSKIYTFTDGDILISEAKIKDDQLYSKKEFESLPFKFLSITLSSGQKYNLN